MEKNRITVPTHYLDAYLATQRRLMESGDKSVIEFAKNFENIKLTLTEHRVLMAIFSFYDDSGHSHETFAIGVAITIHELCKRMGYQIDSKGRFGGSERKEALDALLSLSEKKFSIFFSKFSRKEGKEKYFEVIAIPNYPLLQIVYSASNVSQEELSAGKFEDKVTKIQVRVYEKFYNPSYYKLFEANFYQRLNDVLKRQRRRVGRYHFNFALWCLRQNHHRKPVEINVDKLVEILKIPSDGSHRSRARSIVRQLYQDFKEIGYIESYEVDAPAQKVKTKDILGLKC